MSGRTGEAGEARKFADEADAGEGEVGGDREDRDWERRSRPAPGTGAPSRSRTSVIVSTHACEWSFSNYAIRRRGGGGVRVCGGGDNMLVSVCVRARVGG